MVFPPSKRRELLETNNKRRVSSKTTVFTLNITSMIDMFTILLVFLLKSFSTDGELMTVASNLSLPSSEVAETKPMQTVSIAITQDDLLLNGNNILKWSELESDGTPLIELLYGLLQKEKERLEWFTDLKGESIEFPGMVVIQGDKKIPFHYIEKVMYTCGQAEYNNISLAVLKGDS